MHACMHVFSLIYGCVRLLVGNESFNNRTWAEGLISTSYRLDGDPSNKRGGASCSRGRTAAQLALPLNQLNHLSRTRARAAFQVRNPDIFLLVCKRVVLRHRTCSSSVVRSSSRFGVDLWWTCYDGAEWMGGVESRAAWCLNSAIGQWIWSHWFIISRMRVDWPCILIIWHNFAFWHF